MISAKLSQRLGPKAYYLKTLSYQGSFQQNQSCYPFLASLATKNGSTSLLPLKLDYPYPVLITKKPDYGNK